ncbi:phospholipase-like protein [Tanacetum coccineum]
MLGRQVECLDGETEIVPLSYHLGHDIQIQFGREEFCLLTGLRFVVDYSDVYEEGLIPFRRRVFDSTKDGKPITGEMLEAKINYLLVTASANCSYLLLLLLLLLRVAKHNHNVPDWILRNVNLKHWQPLYATEPEEDDDDHNSYSSKGCRPTLRLTPNDYEARSDWWVSSRGYFDRDIREPVRISHPVNQHSEDDVLIELYRHLEEQDRVLKELLQKDAAREQMYNKMNKFMEELQVGRMPQAKKGPIIIGQHYGLSDLSGFQNTQGFPLGGPTFPTQASTSFFEGAQATPSYDHHTSSRYPYSHPATPNCRNKGRNANVAPFKLGNAFVDDNEVDDEVLITGVRDTDDYIVYENVDPSKMYMPINAGGDHWVTGAINLPNSRFYVFDSLHSEVRMSTLYDHIRN